MMLSDLHHHSHHHHHQAASGFAAAAAVAAVQNGAATHLAEKTVSNQIHLSIEQVVVKTLTNIHNIIQ
jgi:hypothetical protein